MSDPLFTCPHAGETRGNGCDPEVSAETVPEVAAIALISSHSLEAGPFPGDFAPGEEADASETATEPGDYECPANARMADSGAEDAGLPWLAGDLPCAEGPEAMLSDPPLSMDSAGEECTDPGDRPGLPGFDWEDGDASLPLLAGVRLSRSGPMCFFEVGSGLKQEIRELRERGRRIMPGEKLMVETESGSSLGELAVLRHMDPARLGEGAGGCRGEALGFARPEDVDLAGKNVFLASEARAYCQECIRQRDLDMKLVDVEVTHDRSKIAFYFTAPSRIDFRELVKDLVRKYRTRIELRQIGVRHETQMLGAVGNCGMVCCCRRYLRNFVSVAIKMAKEQNIFLNPAKISGICGRLLCCLAYEQDNYDEFYRRCPRLGKKYATSKGAMRVLRANMFRESVSVLSETNEELELTLEEWKELAPRRHEGPQGPVGGKQPGQHQGYSQGRRDEGHGQRDQARPEAFGPDVYGKSAKDNAERDREKPAGGATRDSSDARESDVGHDAEDDDSIFGSSPIRRQIPGDAAPGGANRQSRGQWPGGRDKAHRDRR